MDSRLDNTPNGYVTFNDNGIITEVNYTLCKMLGYDKSELRNAKLETLLDVAGRIFFQTHLYPLLKMQGEANEIFLNLRSKDSAPYPVITSAVRKDTNGDAENVCVFLPVPNRKKYEEEILAAKRQAQEALKENKELNESKEEINRHSKELDKRVNELHRMHDEMLQFNNIINHEMQECVRKILMFSRLSKEYQEEDYIERIIETAQRLKTINSSLNLFIRLEKDHADFKQVDLNECLDRAKKEVIEKTSFPGLEIINDRLPEIEGSAKDLGLLFYHLISNSVKFRKSDKVWVHVSSTIYKENMYRQLNRKYEYHDVVKIMVNDNGQGFNNKHKEYVFALLKKLDNKTPGSGIGLAISKKIVDNHRGSIAVNSTENVGTTVEIVLPLKYPI